MQYVLQTLTDAVLAHCMQQLRRFRRHASCAVYHAWLPESLECIADDDLLFWPRHVPGTGSGPVHVQLGNWGGGARLR